MAVCDDAKSKSNASHSDATEVGGEFGVHELEKIPDDAGEDIVDEAPDEDESAGEHRLVGEPGPAVSDRRSRSSSSCVCHAVAAASLTFAPPFLLEAPSALLTTSGELSSSMACLRRRRFDEEVLSVIAAVAVVGDGSASSGMDGSDDLCSFLLVSLCSSDEAVASFRLRLEDGDGAALTRAGAGAA